MVCSQYPLLSNTYNPNIVIEVTDEYTGYFGVLYEPLLEQMQTTYTEAYSLMGAETVDVSGEPSVIVGGKEYMYFSIVCDYGSYMTYQHIYLTLIGSYMLAVTHTYYQPEDEAIMDAFMQSIVYEL